MAAELLLHVGVRAEAGFGGQARLLAVKNVIQYLQALVRRADLVQVREDEREGEINRRIIRPRRVQLAADVAARFAHQGKDGVEGERIQVESHQGNMGTERLGASCGLPVQDVAATIAEDG